MRKSSKLIVLAAFAAFAVAASFAGAPAGTATAAESATYGANPRSLYVNNCARCHGADGKGLTETGKLYDVPDISGGKMRRAGTRRLTTLISRGKGSMPAFGKKLTAAQITSLVGYVRSL